MSARQRLKRCEGGRELTMHPRATLAQYVDAKVFDETAKRVGNWQHLGPDDELGTVSFVSEDDLRNAAALVSRGTAFRAPCGSTRTACHRMLATGTYSVSFIPGAGYAGDMVSTPPWYGTQWDGLAHGFYDNKKWNAYEDAASVDSMGGCQEWHRARAADQIPRGKETTT